MGKALSYEEAVKIAEKFAQRIFTELDSQAEVYLYGSIAKNESSPRSDIDLAVVSKVFTDDVCNNYTIVNMLAFDIDDKIDAQAIIYEDWINMTPFTAAVKKEGVLIA